MRNVLPLLLPVSFVLGSSAAFAQSPPAAAAEVTADKPAAKVVAKAPKKVTSLFNGKDLSGWKPDVPLKDTDPNASDSFIVRDGVLVSLGVPKGHLISDAAFKDYRLEVEYRFPGKAGNCGVLVHSVEAARALQDVPAIHRSADAKW